jgi:glycosyltransferase involved in cell wall biosynthesis
LRALHVGNYLRREVAGGVEVLAETLARTLAAKGVRVHLVAFTFGPSVREEPLDGFSVTALHCTTKLFTMGIPSPVELRTLMRAVRGADIVQVYFPSPLGTFLGTLFAKLRSKPVVVAVMAHLAADPVSRERGGAYRLASWVANSVTLKWSLAAADRVLEPSPGYLSHNPHTRRFQAKTHLLPLAADTEAFDPSLPRGHIRRKHSIEGKVVLFVGSFRRTHLGKGLPVLMEAIKLLRQEGREDVHLVMVAEGELEAHFLHLASDLGIADRVVHARGVSREELPLYYRDADVFVLPSVWLEAFGLVLAEAMASGTPVIGSRIGGIPYVIGDAGLLVEPGDVGGLAAALRKVLDDPVLALELGARGRQRVLQEFTWSRTAARTLEAYADLLK